MIRNIVETTVDTYAILAEQTDLSPENEVVNNALFNFFQKIKSNNNEECAKHFFQDSRVQGIHADLRALCQKAEERMEYYFSNAFINGAQLNYKDLEAFWYWDSYLSLTNKEINILKQERHSLSLKDRDNVAFVGQGPLPLTMLIFNNQTQLPCIGIDIAEQACKSADLLIKKMNLKNMSNVKCDGALYDYSNTPIIFVASMVPDKKAVLERVIETRQGKPTLINIRTAENLSSVFYEPFNLDDGLNRKLKLLAKTDFDHTTVNTTYCFEIS